MTPRVLRWDFNDWWEGGDWKINEKKPYMIHRTPLNERILGTLQYQESREKGGRKFI